MNQQQNNETHVVKPVAQGTRKDVGVDRRLKDVFISDNAGSVGEYLVWDVLVPGIKGMLQQGLHGAIDNIFGSGRRSGSSYSRSSYGEPSYRSGRTSYSYSSRQRDDRDYQGRYERGRRRTPDTEVVLRSWSDAEDVRDGLIDVLERYGVVSVSDLNALTGQSDRDYTDVNWGWDDVSGAHIRTIRNYFEDGDGYALELPPPRSLKD
jgi:hypothetical protein